MGKNILNEIETMKYLLGYKRGVVISEQEVTDPNKVPNAANDVNNVINAAKTPGSQPETFGGYNNPKAAINQAVNVVNAATGINTQPATAAPVTAAPTTAAPTTAAPTTAAPTTAAPTTATDVVKVGVKNPKITELQNLLNTKFNSGLDPDGKYGPITAKALSDNIQAILALKTTGTPPAATTPTLK